MRSLWQRVEGRKWVAINYVRYGTVCVLFCHIKLFSSILYSCKGIDWPIRKDILLLIGDWIREGGWKRGLCYFDFFVQKSTAEMTWQKQTKVRLLQRESRIVRAFCLMGGRQFGRLMACRDRPEGLAWKKRLKEMSVFIVLYSLNFLFLPNLFLPCF